MACSEKLGKTQCFSRLHQLVTVRPTRSRITTSPNSPAIRSNGYPLKRPMHAHDHNRTNVIDPLIQERSIPTHTLGQERSSFDI